MGVSKKRGSPFYTPPSTIEFVLVVGEYAVSTSGFLCAPEWQLELCIWLDLVHKGTKRVI